MAARRPPMPLDVLPQIVNEVIVTTGKAFKAARRDGKANPAEVSAAMNVRIPAAVERFNSVLDDLEADILRAKSVLLRDLNQLRAERNPPPPEPKTVAPPAPMAIDLTSPKLTAKTEPFTGLPGPTPSGNQANKPVAPFPNMGFDGASPQMAPTPSPKMTAKPRDVKGHGRPPAAVGGVTAGRSTTAPPKKETKVPPPQVPRPGVAATAPQSPLNPSAQVKASPSTVPSRPAPTPTATPNNVPGPAARSSAPPPAGNEKLFTDMTFSPAPPPRDLQPPKQGTQPPGSLPQQQPQPPGAGAANLGAGAANLGAGDLPGFNMEQLARGPADVADMSSVDAKIDGLFSLGSGDMESLNHDYGFGSGDNSNFNDMYFATADSNGGAGDLDDTFFNLNG
ncbi:hypothetical protein C8A03DRAFT_29403 [Achaetomium macrosporum]|uniref:Uncharacterized protein n=1 Tax=Achaetomium macrosporum TaxID=79813 RepID=A0AAN7CIX4_9PEZI|nr:hypothetical protein C8A03DRAFT_29403 [Achaetomium macrosporum]